jgi:hypothetical protein
MSPAVAVSSTVEVLVRWREAVIRTAASAAGEINDAFWYRGDSAGPVGENMLTGKPAYWSSQ